MEVHLYRPSDGERVYVVDCEVVSRDKRTMKLVGRDITIEFTALQENVPLDHDMCPPRVHMHSEQSGLRIDCTRNEAHCEKVITETAGYLYDLSILHGPQTQVMIFIISEVIPVYRRHELL